MGAVVVALRARRARVGVDAAGVALGALVAVAAVLRFATLSSQSYWLDESITAHLLNGSLYDAAAAVHRPGESEGPLYFVLAWFWARVFGTHEFGLRSLSALFGVLTVPVAFAIGKTLVNRGVGLVVAALVCVSPVMIWFSQEARTYALFVLLSALSLLFFVRLLEWRSPVDYVGWSVASSLTLVTHYFAVFPLVVEAAWLLLRRRSRETVLAVGGICLTGLVVAPIALYEKRHGGAGWIAMLSVGGRLRAVGRTFVTGVENPRLDLGVPLVILLACAAALVMASDRSRPRRAASIGLALGAATIGLPLLGTALGEDFFFYRNLLAAWIPLVVAAASLVAVSRWRSVGLAVAAIACGVFLYYDHAIATTERMQRDDWRHVARLIGRPSTARAFVVAPWWEEPALAWYDPCLREMSGPAAVGEVDSIVYENPNRPLPGRPQPPPGPPFRLVGRATSRWISVTRYRAPRPSVVHPSALKTSAPGPPRTYLEPGHDGRASPSGGRCR